MDWLFGEQAVSAPLSLIIQPEGEGRKLAGFREGKPLSLTAKSGETVGAVIERFNTYRGPDSQVKTLWLANGANLSFSHVLKETTTAILRG